MTPTSRAVSEPTATRWWAQREAGSAGSAASPHPSRRLDHGRCTKASPATAATARAARPVTSWAVHRRTEMARRATPVVWTKRTHGLRLRAGGADVRRGGDLVLSGRIRRRGRGRPAWRRRPGWARRGAWPSRGGGPPASCRSILMLLELEPLGLEQRFVPDVGPMDPPTGARGSQTNETYRFGPSTDWSSSHQSPAAGASRSAARRPRGGAPGRPPAEGASSGFTCSLSVGSSSQGRHLPTHRSRASHSCFQTATPIRWADGRVRRPPGLSPRPAQRTPTGRPRWTPER